MMPETIPKPMTSGATDNPNVPQGGDDRVTVIGPDKRTYKFPKGTDKAAAIAYFNRKGIKAAPTATTAPVTTPPAAPAKPKEGFFAEGSRRSAEISQQQWGKALGAEAQGRDVRARIGSGAIAIGASVNEVASDILGGITDPKNLALIGVGLLHPLTALGTASYFAGQAAKEIPDTFTAMLHNPTPDNAKRFYENLATFALASSGAAGSASAPDLIGKIKPTPEGLKLKAAELNTKVLKTADAAKADYKLSSGLQVAQENIMGTMKSLPDKIEKVRAAKDFQVKNAVAHADATGVTIDVTPNLQPILSDAMRVMNQKGVLDAATIREVRSFLDQLTTQVGPGGTRIPRNLRSMKASDAIALTSETGLLSEKAQFNKARPDAVNNLVRRMRYAVNENVGRTLPDVQKLRGEESRLITARDAARANYAKALNDKVSMGRGILYGGAGTLGLYLGLKSLGVMPVAAIGGVVTISALAKSTLSRTVRAALYARAADMIDTSTRAGQPGTGPQGPTPGAGGPQGAPAGGTPPTGGNAPTAPASVVQQGLTTGQPALPAGAPPTSSAAAGGSGTAAGAAADSALFQQARAMRPQASLREQIALAQELKLQQVATQGQSGAQPTTSSPAGAEPDIEMEMRLGTTKPPVQPKPKGVGEKLGTPEEIARITKAQEGRGAKKQALETNVRRSDESVEDWVKRTKESFPIEEPRKYAIFGNKTFSDWLLPYSERGASLRDLAKDLKEKGFTEDRASKGRHSNELVLSFNHPNGSHLDVTFDMNSKVTGGVFAPSDTSKITREVEGASGLPAKQKAMMDRLDALYERQANPKSGADRNAIEREINEIKQILRGEAVGTLHEGAPKRIADRERLAAKRAEAKTEVEALNKTAELAQRTTTPEHRAIALDAGYKKLASYDGGPEMVSALRKAAKDMQRIDPNYDEVTALTEALTALKEVTGQ